MSTRHLIIWVVAIAATIVGGTAIALAATQGGAVPPEKPLATAAHDALAAPAPAGVTARIEFTNHMVSSSSFEGSDPILTGASGRLWLTKGHFRLELQSNQGDAQVVAGDKRFWVYDPRSNTVYRGNLPPGLFAGPGVDRGSPSDDAPPSLAEVQRFIRRLMEHADVSAAVPVNLAGQPAYDVRLSPRSHPGMVGDAELAWDAARGVPLKVGIFARGGSSPVLELKATDVSYGSVPASAFDVSPPPDAKVVDVATPGKRGEHRAGERPEVSGVAAVRSAVGFPLAAPGELAGRARSSVRLLGSGDDAAALVTYGEGLDGIAVIERAAKPGEPGAAGSERGGTEGGGLDLGKVSIDGVPAQELPTPLGTALSFERNGVAFVVVGSVPPAEAEAAARGL